MKCVLAGITRGALSAPVITRSVIQVLETTFANFVGCTPPPSQDAIFVRKTDFKGVAETENAE